jgi:lysozyme family protein
MEADFARSLANVLVDEGGNDDDPHDPGGRTSRGIIQREYDAYRRSKGEMTQDVWTASDTEIADIYKTQYWNPWCDQLPAGVDYLYFDMAVNMGPVEAAKLLQRGLGVNDDGHIGMVTLGAIKTANPLRLISDVSDRKRAFYRSLRGAKYYLKGWLARTQRVENIALKMAAVADLPDVPPGATG